MLSVDCWMVDIGRLWLGFRYPILIVGLLGLRYWVVWLLGFVNGSFMLKIKCSVLTLGCWVLDLQCCMLDI